FFFSSRRRHTRFSRDWFRRVLFRSPVNAFTVSQEHVVSTDTYPGTVVPLQEVELRAQVSGYITQIFVQDGQKVTKGQKLYEIDRSEERRVGKECRSRWKRHRQQKSE